MSDILNSDILNLDVVIFGSGIAGLWSLTQLRKAGYATLLLESQRLGGIQTIASQGIIHGGTKYALTGHLTDAAQAIKAMPGIWRSCLSGTGALDLSEVKVLTDHQFLWSTGNLSSKLTSLLASKAMQSRVVPIYDRGMYPKVLQHADFNGYVYRLEEPVLNMESLILSLEKQNKQAILWLEPASKLSVSPTHPWSLELTDPKAGTLCLQAKRLVLAAGRGNEDLLEKLGRTRPSMQLRPLHMLMLQGVDLPPFYAHCLGMSANPRLTITSHQRSHREWVWYIGGQIAESGVHRSQEEQIAQGKRELAEVLPWLDTGLVLSQAHWSSFLVDRAEPKFIHGLRPDKPFLHTQDGISVAWPTKLAFAPALSTILMDDLAQSGIQPSGNIIEKPKDWPIPPTPKLPWVGT